MKKHFNNKGYMLVEIILASVLAMIVAYFVIELTIKLKNKNDDLLVKTLVSTDQAIIYNTIMKDVMSSDDVDCAYIENKISIDKDKNTFTYGDFTNVVSEYATIGDVSCENSGDSVKLNIPISVKQLPDEEFDVVIRDELTEFPEQQITLVGCRDSSDTNRKYYENGNSYSVALVGKMPYYEKFYVVRYKFTTTSEQRANSVKVILRPATMYTDAYVTESGSPDHLRFYIGTDPDSHKNARGSSTYSGNLTYTSQCVYSGYENLWSNGGNKVCYKLVGTADVEIKPNTTYYLWVFSDGTSGIFKFDQGDSFNGFADVILNPKPDSTLDSDLCE